MGRYGNLDYARLTKLGFLLGVAFLLVGAGGEWAIHTAGLGVPAWTDTFFFDLEVLGVVVALFTPIVFGIVLPLTE